VHVLVIGAGVFGVTAALELRRRGHHVSLKDPGPLPHPLAESTDISKVVRIDYGGDADYTALGELALDGWRQWNAAWPRPLFHETGVTFLSRSPMEAGGFEHDSFELLSRRGHHLERLDADAIAARFPAYRKGVHVDGYYNPTGGWAESGAVVARLAALADEAGVAIETGREVERPDDTEADLVIVCAGSWVPTLLPELAPSLRASGQPVFHLQPADPAPFAAERFPVFGADISRTGYYGFPANSDGIVKIANHGKGVPIAPGDPREVTDEHEAALRAFLADAFPLLADAPIVYRRLCVYCDTLDGHFWIARHPERPRIVVATGGSGHGFKFAPVLGALIADIALGEPHPLAPKFRWRPEIAASPAEAARHHG
jgi:glycine/D-amino acid oxidase-like deaminating enzyme